MQFENIFGIFLVIAMHDISRKLLFIVFIFVTKLLKITFYLKSNGMKTISYEPYERIDEVNYMKSKLQLF